MDQIKQLPNFPIHRIHRSHYLITTHDTDGTPTLKHYNTQKYRFPVLVLLKHLKKLSSSLYNSVLCLSYSTFVILYALPCYRNPTLFVRDHWHGNCVCVVQFVICQIMSCINKSSLKSFWCAPLLALAPAPMVRAIQFVSIFCYVLRLYDVEQYTFNHFIAFIFFNNVGYIFCNRFVRVLCMDLSSNNGMIESWNSILRLKAILLV